MAEETSVVHRFTVRVDMAVLMRWGSRQIWRTMGVQTLLVVLLFGLLIWLTFGHGRLAWSAGGMIAVAVMVPLILRARFAAIYRDYLATLHDGVVHYEVDAEGFTAQTPLAASRIRWEAFVGIRKDRDAWFLMLRPSIQRQIGLPTDQIAPEILAFIDEQIAARVARQ